MVVVKDTVSDVLTMGRYLHEVGVNHFSTGLVSYCGQAVNNNLLVGRREVALVYNQLKQVANETGMSVSLTGGMPHCVMPELDGVVEMANVCDAAIYQIVIGPDGGIRPCVESSVVVGNALKDNLKEVWINSPELISIREFRGVPESCYECKLVAECRGGCRASALRYSGEITGIDPLMKENP
jgi:radical SAM protein with 4Fe4S-binding SPASM domain